MDAWFGENPPGAAEADAALAWVRSSIAALEALQRELPRLTDLDWRSPAAEEFSAFLEECLGRLGATLQEFEAGAEALRHYGDDLRTLNPGEG